MELQSLQQFFMWCTIICGTFYTISAVMCVFAGNWIYTVHSRWFPMPRETFTVVLYGYLGFFKILFIVFILVPWLALLMIG
ncbi:MAG: hypothetical protein J7K75_03670 [Desulfuromonas sp.]|nr:hypothetical protein [Desulfuromonas sp.]